MKLIEIMSGIYIELGYNKIKNPGFIRINRHDFPMVDIVANMNNGIPLKDNSADLIYISYYNAGYSVNINNLMGEVYRVGKKQDNRLCFFSLLP